MGDAAAILGIVRSPRTEKEKKKPALKRPEGMSREVFALLESGELPPVVPAQPVSVFKERRNLGKGQGWQWRPFANAARTDGLMLHHWAKASEDLGGYTFAKYNKQLDMFEYTAEEYAASFEDPNWTKEETDALFAACKRFALRWPVIHDQLPFTKPLEDLKERFYTIQRALLEAKAPAGTDLSTHPLMLFPFNRDLALQRKEQLNKLQSRTAAEIAEEAFVLEEAKRIQAERKAQKHALKAAGKIVPKFATEIKATRREVGVFVRSRQLLAPVVANQKTQARVDEILGELGVSLQPLATKAVVEEFDALRRDIVRLLEVQKYTQSKELEVHQQRLKRLHSQMSEQPL